MTAPNTESQVQNGADAQQQQSTKELNFRALEQRHHRQLEQERSARMEAEKKLESYNQQRQQILEDDDDSEPYVDKKRLEKKFNQFGQTQQSEIQKAMEIAKHSAKEELKQEMWLENNPDFYDVLQHAEKFAQRSPKLAETILRMPEGFERQKLVYQNIKELGIDKPASKEPSIQDRVDANRRNPGYQPSGLSASPYSQQGDFSASGQKSAYEKMQALKANLRI